MEKLEYKEVWTGKYRDIRFEVVHWYMGWNYYLFIQAEQLPDDLQKGFNLKNKSWRCSPDSPVRYHSDYESAPIISDLEWHGGITFYEKHRNEIGKVTCYKLGCDYQHSFDMGEHYTIDVIAEDAKKSIDKLWELVPNMKVRCAWNGTYHPIEETYLTDRGVRVALVNKEKYDRP